MDYYNFIPQSEDIVVTPYEEADRKLIASELAMGNKAFLIDKTINLKPLRKSGLKNKWDFYWLTPEGVLCTESTKNILFEITKGCGEWSKMFLLGEPLFFFSVTKTLEALDYDNTSFIKYNNIIVGVRDYVFLEKACQNTAIFRTQLQGDYPVVNQEFVDLIKNKNLMGIEFKLLSRQ